jgi:uncharacterized RDD family membrane protein YckC
VGFWRRVAAFAVDLCLFAVVALAVREAYWVSLVHTIVTAFVLTMLPFVYRISLHRLRAATLGKAALGLEVVGADGTRLGWLGASGHGVGYVTREGLLFVRTAVTVSRANAAQAFDLAAASAAFRSHFEPSWTAALYPLLLVSFLLDLAYLAATRGRRWFHDVIGGSVAMRRHAVSAPVATESESRVDA